MRVIDISFKDTVGNQMNFSDIDGSINGFIEISINGSKENVFFTMSELEIIMEKIRGERGENV